MSSIRIRGGSSGCDRCRASALCAGCSRVLDEYASDSAGIVSECCAPAPIPGRIVELILATLGLLKSEQSIKVWEVERTLDRFRLCAAARRH